jgi:hypothetical protein
MNNQTTELKASIVNAESIELSYGTLPGNRPKSYGNWLGIWQGAMIRSGQKPVWRVPVQSDERLGRQILGDLQLQRKPYMLGYANGKSLGSVGATVQFLPGQTAEGTYGIAFSTKLTLAAYNAHGLVVNYSTPPGNVPVENENWIGLWEGDLASFSQESLIKKVSVTQRSNQSSQAITDVVLAYKSTYTVAYGNSKEDTAIAASITFETGEALA